MRITAHVPAGVALILAATLVPAAGAVLDVPHLPLVIRLYGIPALPSGNGDTALNEARIILEDAGLAPEWIPCAPAPSAAARCAVPLHGTELAVRIVAAPEERAVLGRLPMGYSLVDARTRTGSLATVFVNRVAWLAEEGRADASTLLGRALAHEIGHLLLGTNEHTQSGLMRAIWSRESVRQSRGGDWRFMARDAKNMRAAVMARSMATQMVRNGVTAEGE
jgi:hypothetical protein